MSMGQIHANYENPELAPVYFDSARILLESLVKKYPTDFHFSNELALAYSIVGRHEDAIAEGLRAKELMPINLCHW